MLHFVVGMWPTKKNEKNEFKSFHLPSNYIYKITVPRSAGVRMTIGDSSNNVTKYVLWGEVGRL